MASSFENIRLKVYKALVRYFVFWAGFSFRRWRPRVVAITGSVGKTILLHILDEQFDGRAHCSFDANSEIGIALDILGETGVLESRLHWLRLILLAPFKALRFTRNQPFYIVEIDLARPQTSQKLTRWLKPERTLWVSHSMAHVVNFDQPASDSGLSVDQLIAAEMEILAQNTKQVVYIDAGLPEMAQILKSVDTKVQPVKDELLNYQVKADSSHFKFKQASFSFASPQPKQISRQLAYCIQLVQDLKLDLKSDLSAMYLPPGRSSYFVGKSGFGMIDSSYNAQIESVLAILSMFDEIEAQDKWIVIGDMVEQGSYTQSEHKRLAKALIKLNPARAILVGKRSHSYIYPALKHHQPDKVVSFLKPKPALDYLKSELKGSELVLFKGSFFLEGIIESLLKNPEQAALLCRRNRLARRWRNKWELP